MTIHEFARMVSAMRAAQKAYFRTRTQSDLEESKRQERAVDLAVHGVLSPPTLFGRKDTP